VAINLGKWLKDREKQARGIYAQVNPFDGGRTYDTTVNNKRPGYRGISPQAQNQIRNAKYGVLANNRQAQDNFLNSNQPNRFNVPMATFQSLKEAPGRVIKAPFKGLTDIKSSENSSDYLKPNSGIENVVGSLSNLGQFNPIRSVGDVGQYLDTLTEGSRFQSAGNTIGSKTRGMSNFGKPIEGSAWAPQNLDNRIAREVGGAATMLGQTANYAAPGFGGVAIAGTVASEADDVAKQLIAKGENPFIAHLKGLASGGTQAAIERYSSKVQTKLPFNNSLQKNLIGRLATGGVTEGAEEFFQGLTGNAARGNKLTEGLARQTLEGAKGGLLLGGFFGGANTLANRSQGITQQVEQQVEANNPLLQQRTPPAAPGSVRERIQIAKENVKSSIVNSQLMQNEGGYIELPDGRREVVTNKPSTFDDFRPEVEAGKISDNVEIVPRDFLIKGPGTDSIGLDQKRIQEWQKMIRDDVSIPPLITDPTGRYVNDGGHRLPAFSREKITDVPIVREISKKPPQQFKLSKQDGFYQPDKSKMAQAKAEYEATVGSRPQAILQKQIEDAHNSGNTSLEQRLIAQLKDQALDPNQGGYINPGVIASDIKSGVTNLANRIRNSQLASDEGGYVRKPGNAPQVGKTPETVKIWTKSRFNPDSKGTYADYPVIRQEDNITLYQGSNPGEQRQYWTPNKKYAEQFGEVKEKTGSFYKIDNGNRMTDVYVEAPSKPNPTPVKVGETDATGQTKQQKTLEQPKVQTEPIQQSQIPQKTSLSTDTPGKVQKTLTQSQIEISSDGRIANIDQYIKEQVNAQEVETKKSVKEKVKTLKRQWIDTLSPAEDNFRQLVKDGKLSQETLDDIIVKNGKSLRAGTAANLNLIESGLVDLIYKKSKTDYDNLGQTLIAIHSKDLRANGIETGRSPKLDEQIIGKYGKQFEADIEQFRKSADYVLNQSVDAQLISKETADMLKKKYPNYVPMNRVIEEIEAKGSFNSGQVASIGKQTVVRKIKGSKRVVENPMESMISKIQDMSKQKLRNEAALSWVDALKDAGDAKLVKGTVKPGQSTISVLRKGVKEIYAVDSEMEAAAKGLTKEQMNFAVEAARKVSRVFKTGTTGLNLPFIITNLARDQQTSLLNMQKGELSFFKAAPGAVFETLKHGDLYQEAVRQGAISTSFDLTKPNLKQTAQGIRKKGASLGVFSKIEDVISRSEEYTRMQQYKATKEYWLKKGFSEDQAITKATIAAQQNSADFARAGDFGRVINAVMPYTNAGVQGTRAYLRSAKANPKRYALKASATILTPMVMVALWNYGDDEREKIINDVSDFEKQSNFIIVTPWAKKNEEGKWEGLAKIPKPPGISALTYPIEQTIAWAKGNDPIALGDITKAVLGFASPLGDNLNSAASTVTPQALKPLAEIATNRNIFTGRDIVPFYMKKKPTKEQAFSYTSGTARGIGKVINTSPLNIEHLIRGYGGEVGLQGLNAIDNVLNKVGVLPKEQIGGRSIPSGFVRRFTEAYDKPNSTLDKGSTTNKTVQSKGDVISITDRTEKDSSGKYKTRDKYDAILDVYSGDVAKNINSYDSNEIKKAISDVSGEAKKLFTDSNLPTDGLRFDSRLAREYASFRKSIEGKNELEQIRKTQYFVKDTYKSTLDDVSKTFYTLGDDDMRAELQKGTISKGQMDKVVALDDMLTEKGLQSYYQVGKRLRYELGYAGGTLATSRTGRRRRSGRKGGGRGGRGGSKAGKTDLVNSYKLQNETLKKLTKLLESTRFKGGKSSGLPKVAKAKQKAIKVDMTS
jgi:hypothetical protein